MTTCSFNNMLDLDNTKSCSSCESFSRCKEIKEKYKIQDEDERIIFVKANKFVKDVFNAGWSHHYSFRDYAIQLGYAEKEIKGTKKDVWVISYKNIIKMMFHLIPFYEITPLYKRNTKGFMYGQKNR